MIQANELRIGNWVYVGKAWPKKVESLDERGINLEVSYGEYGSTEYDGYFDDGLFYKSDLRPIPLTPEILQKCGAVLSNQPYPSWILPDGYDGVCSTKFAFYTGNEKPFEKLFTVVSCAEDGYNAPCEYLHQLQNLYFALTGKELEFKP